MHDHEEEDLDARATVIRGRYGTKASTAHAHTHHSKCIKYFTETATDQDGRQWQRSLCARQHQSVRLGTHTYILVNDGHTGERHGAPSRPALPPCQRRDESTFRLVGAAPALCKAAPSLLSNSSNSNRPRRPSPDDGLISHVSRPAANIRASP